jgi:hypothetical protein
VIAGPFTDLLGKLERLVEARDWVRFARSLPRIVYIRKCNHLILMLPAAPPVPDPIGGHADHISAGQHEIDGSKTLIWLLVLC